MKSKKPRKVARRWRRHFLIQWTATLMTARRTSARFKAEVG
jgi:hypothetical protein